MDIYSAYKILDKQLLEVLDTVNVLNTVEEPEKEVILRIKENPFKLSSDAVSLNRAVMTAHDINQYKNQVYTISLHENIHSWLEELLNIDGRGGIYAA